MLAPVSYCQRIFPQIRAIRVELAVQCAAEDDQFLLLRPPARTIVHHERAAVRREVEMMTPGGRACTHVDRGEPAGIRPDEARERPAKIELAGDPDSLVLRAPLAALVRTGDEKHVGRRVIRAAVEFDSAVGVGTGDIGTVYCRCVS